MPENIASGAKWGVLVPASNTVVEYELNTIRPRNISFHASRIVSDNMDIATGSAFTSFVDNSVAGIWPAVSAIMKCEPSHLILGYSAAGWRGDTDTELRAQMAEQSGVGVTTPGIAFTSALEHVEAKRIAIISPYPAEFLHHVSEYFDSHGFEVIDNRSHTVPTATGIASISDSVIVNVVKEVDRDDVDAIIQVGGNLPMLRLADSLERWLQKPVLSMTAVLMRHALRANGIDEVFEAYGSILRG
jgi:maleate isomerase